MTTRRQFLGHTAAVTGSFIAAPAFLRAAEQPPYRVAEKYEPQEVRVKSDLPAGEIYVVTARHFLYLTLGEGRAMRYGVAVGKAGLNFRGRATIARKVKWPSWRPTPDMIERNPSYAKYEEGMPGGPGNPLGSRALYLYQNGYDTAYRIHGTTQPSSVGRSVSNGCIRMTNWHVEELYERVPLGTRVTVYS
ncbi:MAG: L,D-transpeptidase [Pseudomonadota bacterium]